MSRIDSVGLWWQDAPRAASARGRKRELGPMPPVPETGWKAPKEFPNLSAAKLISYDVETYDPELLTAGPGWGRGKGHIVGASLAVEDGTSWYFPMRHEVQAEDNMDPDQVLRFLKHTLEDNRPKTGANLIYDFGWLLQEGIRVGGTQYDVQFAEALLNSEAPDVSLDALAHKYLGMGKVTNHLYQWLADWFGGKPDDRQRKHLYKSPPRLAGPYGEADAALPVHILNAQWGKLQERGVHPLFDIECRLIPLLVDMRMQGVPVDVEFAERLHEDLGEELVKVEAKLKDLTGVTVNPAARETLLRAFRAVGLDIPTKDNGKISFDKNVLKLIDHPLAELILEHRGITKVRDTFVGSYVLNKNVNGILYTSFHPLRGEGRGARSGRFASSDPNLQNIPIRTDIGKKVRHAFVASQGRKWLKADYSQIEYRMLAHHACGEGAEELRLKYNSDPNTDYHDYTYDMIVRRIGKAFERRKVKTINFGLIYGMSQPALARNIEMPAAAANELFTFYHQEAPYVRATMQEAAREVHQHGYVETVLGRRSDFNMWSSREFSERAALSYEAAVAKWGFLNIERAFTHKALNRKLQGGAADVMKKAMVTAYESGIFAPHLCGLPSLTVHDELDFPHVEDEHAQCWKEFKETMENSVPELRVPVRIDMHFADNWGSAD